VEPLELRVLKEGGAVVICVTVRPELQCFCLEHEWRVKVEGPGGIVQEWGWRARAGEEGYRGLSLKWVPPARGEYRVTAELVTHAQRVEGGFSHHGPRVALIFYSRTGTTRALTERVARELESKGFEVELRGLELEREYGKPLHVNPRLVSDTLRGTARVKPLEGFDPCSYSAVIFACPIWIGRPAAPMTAFLKSLNIREKCADKPAACLTTSLAPTDYSTRLAALAERAGFKVVYRYNARKGQLSSGELEKIASALAQT